MLNKLLFKQVDNSALIVFRVFFGLLIFLESVGAIFTGWVRRTLIEPEFTFSFIGFEWLQPLPNFGMYIYYAIMGICGLMVMLGFFYRYGLGLFTILWTFSYLMQKSSYNNHYYLLILVCGIMLLFPASNYLSFDVKRDPYRKAIAMPNWVNVVIILQLFIVYTYASVAKIYPDWLNGTVMKVFMSGKKNYDVIGEFLQQEWWQLIMTYAGILFDLLVVPLLLWKPTRKWIFAAAIFFHLFNSIVFRIGIFPYLSLAFCLFFFPPKTIQSLFLKRKPLYEGNAIKPPKYGNLAVKVMAVYFVIQILLPLRHWVIKDDVLWTEEGHRMSWRMMLRTKQGAARFKIVDKNTGDKEYIDLNDHLTKKQQNRVKSKPDMMWQFAQYLKKEYQKQGKEISVFVVNSRLRVNRKEWHLFIDPNVDLAAEKWNHFKHHEWILPSPEE